MSLYGRESHLVIKACIFLQVHTNSLTSLNNVVAVIRAGFASDSIQTKPFSIDQPFANEDDVNHCTNHFKNGRQGVPFCCELDVVLAMRLYLYKHFVRVFFVTYNCIAHHFASYFLITTPIQSSHHGLLSSDLLHGQTASLYCGKGIECRKDAKSSQVRG